MTTKTNLDVNVHVDAKKKWKKSSWSTLAKKSKDIDGKKKHVDVLGKIAYLCTSKKF